MIRTGIIYKWTCINKNIPEYGMSYIGQTKQPKKRYNAHIKSVDNSWFHRTLQKHGLESFTYEVLESYTLEENELRDVLNEREKYYIKTYNTYPYFNKTEGGEGFVMNETKKKNNTRHYIFTEEHKIKIGLSHKGLKYKMPENWKERVSQSYWVNILVSQKPFDFVVKCYDGDGSEHKLTHEQKQHISKVRIERGLAKGENNPMYGNGYKLKGEKNGRYGSAKYKNIKQWDLNGNLIKEWFSIYEAAKATKISHIEESIENPNKIRGGFKWTAELNPNYKK